MTTSTDNFISILISRTSRASSRPTFGAVMIAAFLTWMAERARTFSEPEEMLEAGCPEDAPEYLAAVALCAQENRPSTFKVGRREGAPVQTIRLTPSTPSEGTEYSVTIGGVEFAYTAESGDAVGDVCDELVRLVNADPDAIIASGVATALTSQELGAADFDGVVGAGEISPPRNLTLTLNAHADWDATSIVVTGLDANGRVQTESFLVPNGGDTALVGTKVFSRVTGVAIPAQTGPGGTLLMGVGSLFTNERLAISAVDGATHVDIASSIDGRWFAYTEIADTLAIEDRTAEPTTTLAADLAAILDVDQDFAGLVIADAQSKAQILAAATAVEPLKRVLYIAHSFDTAVTTDAIDDVATTLLDANRLWSKVFYNRRSHGLFPDASVFGRIFSDEFPPGSASFEFKTLSGVLPDRLTTTVYQRLVGTRQQPAASKRAMVYVEVAQPGTNRGTAVTVGGLSAGGEWLDVLRGLSWVQSELAGVTWDLQLSVPKVPYTAKGAGVLEGKTRNVLLRASRAPYNIFDEASVATQAAPVEDAPEADRQNRYYDGVRFAARVQGAMRAFTFRGAVGA